MPQPPAQRPHGTADRNQDDAVRMDVESEAQRGRKPGAGLPVDAEQVPGNDVDDGKARAAGPGRSGMDDTP